MLTDKRKQAITELCQELIKRKSYSGMEVSVIAKIKEVFQALRYDDIFVDSYGNIIGHIKGKKQGPAILLDGHVDTVPVPDEAKWSVSPFGGEIKEGKLFGRGSSDMKGAVSAMILAAAYYASDTNKVFSGDIYVACGVHEECFEGVAARMVSEKVNPDFVVIGEASELNLKVGQRGRAEIVIETFGKSAHSSNPEAGINAVYEMTKLIERIKDLETPHHEVLGRGILELTDIKSSPYPGSSVVPDYCCVTYDRRLLIGETKESVLEPIQSIIKDLQQQNPEFKAEVSFAFGSELCYTGETICGERFFPGWLMEQSDPFIQTALISLKEEGLASKISHYSFCTNGSHYAGEKGINTIGFGPSRENMAHIRDEYIEIQDLYDATKGYYAILRSVLNKNE